MAYIASGNNEIYIRIYAEGEQAVRSITQLSRSFSNLAGAAEAPRNALHGMSSASRGLGDSVRSLIGFLGGLQLSLSAIREGKHLVELASDFQKLGYAWEKFIGTGEKSQAELKWVEELGGRTYGIRNLTRAMIDLQATGIQPTKQEMEGLLGYLMAAGKTQPHQLAALIDRITALFQLGNIGMEDALKEITEHVPFLMAALREKMNLSVSDMYQEFTRRGVDFATIIRAIFEYAGRNFADGLKDTENFWDVLINRMRAKKELFEKELMQSGSFQGITAMVSNWISQLDVLEQDGTLRRWAIEVGDNLEKVGEALGLCNLDMKTVGETVVGFSSQFETLAGVAKGVANAIEGVGESLRILGNISKELGGASALGEAAAYGLIGKMLFRSQVGQIIFALVMLKNISDKMNKDLQIPDPFANWSMDTKPRGSPEPLLSDKLKSWLYQYDGSQIPPEGIPPDWPFGSLSSRAVTDSAKTALDNFKIATKTYMDGVGSSIDAMKKEAEAASQELADTMLGVFDKATTQTKEGIAANTKYGVESPLVFMAMKKFYDLTSKVSTQIEQVFNVENLAGKTEFERWEAEQLNRMEKIRQLYEQQVEQIYKVMEAHKADNRIESLAEDEKLLNDVTARYMAAWNSFYRAREKQKAFWDQKDAERGAIGVERVDQDVMQLRREYDRVRFWEREIESELIEERAIRLGDVLSAEYAKIDKESFTLANKLDQEGTKLAIAINRFKDKVLGPGKKPTPEALAAYEQAKAIEQDFYALYDNIIKKANEVEALKKWGVTEDYQVKRTESMARAQVEVAKLGASVKELADAEYELAAAEGYSLWYQAQKEGAYKKELDLLWQLRERQMELARLKVDGTVFDGIIEGARQISIAMPTAFDRGVDAMKMFKSGLDNVADSMAEFVLTGKMNFEDLADSVIRSMVRMAIQALITDRIMGAVFSFLGVGAKAASGAGYVGSSSGFLSYSLGLGLFEGFHQGGIVGVSGTPRLNNPDILIGAPRMHDGGMVDIPGMSQFIDYNVFVRAPKMHYGGVIDAPEISQFVNPDVFIGAPRFHTGLAWDEVPAILQKGEMVIPKVVVDVLFKNNSRDFGQRFTEVPKMHQGGIAGISEVPKLVDPNIFIGARRFHSGLAWDEFPAILQKGETVIPKNQSAKTSISSTINVNVNVPAGGGGINPQAAEQMGKEIGKAVRAEFVHMLEEQLRPGNTLNKGMVI